MAEVEFRNVEKVFPDGTHAIHPLALAIDEGELMVFVGPSGCGKSTLMRMLAGLEECTGGEIVLDGKVVNDWTPQQRNVAMVFQNYALYPHMSVRGNLEFPLRMRRLARAEIDRQVDAAAQLLGLTDLLERKPRQLSGGQRQRVAMGRALVREPSVFLMDEPLSNLDARLRVQIRTEIAALQRRTATTTIYVTHDQVEAMTLGHRVAVLRDGVLQQVAAPQALYEAPANVFVASFLGSPGMNLFPATLQRREGEGVTLEVGGQRLELADGALGSRPDFEAGAVVAGVRPEALAPMQRTSPVPRLRVEVEAVESLGHERLVYGRVPGVSDESEAPSVVLGELGISPGRITARLPADASVESGSTIELGLPPERLFLFKPDGTAY